MNTFADWYKKDLAYIHDVGFSDFALKSAPEIIKILQKNKINSGLIVDLGCGSGLSAQEFIQANYQVLGIDISRSLIEIAKNRVPQAEFKVESLFKTQIPNCVAVTSINECLNYLFDQENNIDSLSNLFNRVYQALTWGGMFIFDILEPFTTRKTQGFKEGKDWLILYEKEEDQEQTKLTRRIITFRQSGKFYQRDEEIHQVRLYKASGIINELEKIGFSVDTRNDYGQFQLSAGHTVFLAKKSSRTSSFSTNN